MIVLSDEKAIFTKSEFERACLENSSDKQSVLLRQILQNYMQFYGGYKSAVRDLKEIFKSTNSVRLL